MVSPDCLHDVASRLHGDFILRPGQGLAQCEGRFANVLRLHRYAVSGRRDGRARTVQHLRRAVQSGEVTPFPEGGNLIPKIQSAVPFGAGLWYNFRRKAEHER